jgi:hypothetical protein
MPIDLVRCRKLLDAFDLDTLFVEVLGWDRHKATLRIATKHGDMTLKGFAEKRGFAAFICEAGSDGRIPDHAIRAQIDREVTKSAREHIIIYANKQRTEQVWQWVRRGHGADGQRQPLKRREFNWRNGQASGLLVERVMPSICFSLGEEEKLTLPEVTSRASKAFDVEKVTKKFFERFKAEHEAFHKFIGGIQGVADKDWYASVMLNRLMFCYFIQKKGLLDGDHDYLRNRLSKLQSTNGPVGGKDKFWSFYRQFLLRLFHEGLSTKANQRAKELDALIGKIPYLNGGLFDVHELEMKHKEIKIPDLAFERLFKFFDEYTWHLDDRPLTQGNEINPDVLGYIFEKYINQKQMGAYYTKEDITEYISKNTIIPFILDQAAKNCAIAFKPPDASESGSVWRLLKSNPDRYIYNAVLHGVVDEQGKIITLPAEIEAGVTDVAKRGGWNKPASAPFALPTETWREHVARRQRCLELREKLSKGEVQTVNDLVTLNLDIRQFAEDVIVNAEGPDLLRAVWKAVESVTVLDPTCGSGAFLFAALNILEPLYEACLDRMESFLDDLKRAEAAGEKVHADKFKDFKEILRQVELHPNTRYFILKSIIVNNLYGVDIMEEACEICKLRLFLKLVAQVEEGVIGIEKVEPLPDIDFNIRAGNTLVGFVSEAALRASRSDNTSQRFDFGDELAGVLERCEQLKVADQLFRQMQTEQGVGSEELVEGKTLVRQKLNTLHEELDRYLASEYEVNPDKPKLFADWRKSHEPFHWIVDFYSIMSRGGFDVIIGNPPYVEYHTIKNSYQVLGLATETCKNLYAYCLERCFKMSHPDARIGMIVQLSAVCTDRMTPLQKEYLSCSSTIWSACFDDRPGKLFDGLEHIRAVIILSQRSAPVARPKVHSTNLMRWLTEARGTLFPQLAFGEVSDLLMPGSFPKVGDRRLHDIVGTLRRLPKRLDTAYSEDSDTLVYYYRSPLYWIRAMDFLPYFKSDTANRSMHHFKDFPVKDSEWKPIAGAIINSTLFYLWFVVVGNGRNVTLRDIQTFPIPETLKTPAAAKLFGRLFADLMADYKRHSVKKQRKDGVQYQEFNPSESKPLMDKIDVALADHFGLSSDDLDYVLNYDVRFRLGADDDQE